MKMEKYYYKASQNVSKIRFFMFSFRLLHCATNDVKLLITEVFIFGLYYFEYAESESAISFFLGSPEVP